MSERKNPFNFSINADFSNVYSKTNQITKINVSVRKGENRIAPHSLIDENSFSDPVITSNVSSSVHSNNIQKSEISKLTTTHFGNNKMDIGNSTHTKFSDKSSNSTQKLLNFSPDISIEKIIAERKQFELSKEIDGTDVIRQTKMLMAETTNLMYKTNKNIKDESCEVSSEIKKKVNDSKTKSFKSLSKKGKKGVDSLLEKLESCNKRLCSSDNFGSPTVMLNTEEKDTNSVKSLSPEYYKSRSPNNREDDVISPSFSNDDSNDTKQRRKRKLGKPVRLAKDLKSEHEDTELEGISSKLPTKLEVSDCTVELNRESLLQNSLLSSLTYKHTIQKRHFNISEETNPESYPSINNKNKNELLLSEFNMKNISLSGYKLKNNEYIHGFSDSSIDILNKNYKIETRHPSGQTPKDKHFTRIRRNSECLVNALSKTTKKRRKSCDDIRELLNDTISKTSSTNNAEFSEVESQLEKMFAGIIESDKDLKKPLLETEKSVIISDDEQKENCQTEKIKAKCLPNNFVAKINDTTCKKDKKKSMSKIRPYRKKSTNAVKEIEDTSFNCSLKDKKKQLACKKSIQKSNIMKKKKINSKTDGYRETVYDSSINSISLKSRGPVIQIKGPKNNPIYIQIINSIREDDEEKSREKRKIIGNGFTGRSKRLNYQNNLDFRGKVSNSGLFNSTLSVRYDSHTADATWICVFCKRGPHHIIPGDTNVPAGILSDLFGPYLIEKDVVEENVVSPDEQEITKEQKQGNINKRSLRYSGLADQFLAKVSKRKKKSSNNTNNVYLGMSMIGSEQQQWEVWLHEQCIIWTAGIYITGGRISGLQDSVWDATKSVCDTCGISGANIGCIKRGCTALTHYCCGVQSGWYLNIDEYISKCNNHEVI